MQKRVFDQIKESKILYIVLSIFIAIFLWLYVINVENPDIDMSVNNISVNLLGEDEIMNLSSLMVTNNNNPSIDIIVRGKRSDLAKLDSNSILVNCDLTGLTAAGNYKLNYMLTLPTDVSPNNVQVINRSTSMIDLTVSKYISKSVAMSAELDGSIAEGYVEGDFRITPEKVTVSGSEEIINQIEYGIAVLKHNNVDKDIKESVSYKLYDINGNEIDTRNIHKDSNKVDVEFTVLRLKELPLTVEFTDGGGAKKENVVYSIVPVSLKVSGLQADVEKLKSVSLGTIDLSNITSNQTMTFNIVLPEGIRNNSDIQTANVSIGFKDLSIKTIQAINSNISLLNVPNGFRAELITQTLSVDIRGTEADLSLINALNLIISADLSKLKDAGEYTVQAAITLEGARDAGILGNYNIVVSLSAV